MAALKAALSLPSLLSSSCSKSFLSRNPQLYSIKLQISNSLNALSLKFPLSHFPCQTRKFCIQQCSTTQEVTVEAEPAQTEDPLLKRKIYVANFPWTFTAADFKTIFGQCGTVTDVEIIRDRDGKQKGYAFLTMGSEEEAQAAIEKFNSQEVSGRTFKVAYAKRLNKPDPPPTQVSPAIETRHKLYVSNLAWKVRASHLREFFSTDFTLVSARVVFEGPSGRSAGYGFVSFATKEEAEAAIAALHGKELMGRPVRLKFSERSVVDPENKKEKEEAEAEPEPEPEPKPEEEEETPPENS
ncbi:29 kDa ribonucleoprotein A chloroplastic [Tripterygium wilfordii]|uniref:29 kDa ribonucleoprotein A chloroplastic n=1 Tax=Tripterygium wilfordii TaxID=458696 RepID=A0A7J7C6G6_TRIWF|nr:RNA-binding protein CP33, chloroplastic-like [Tripterygium wilfordii]KAF5729711.1 29 kDa ribonucleoprotein A chloroplastic [Tripterygium wilfordii]